MTCEATPHHLTLTDADVAASGYNTNFKMSPPLRSGADREALIAGLADGTIDCIATDHAPHHQDDKEVEFALARNGITGLETAVGLVLDRLVQPGRLTLEQMVLAFSTRPAEIVGKRPLTAGRSRGGYHGAGPRAPLDGAGRGDGQQEQELSLYRPGAGGGACRHHRLRAAGDEGGRIVGW